MTFEHDAGYPRGTLDRLELVLGGDSRLAVVERHGPEDLAIGRDDRLGPACTQTEGERPGSIVVPQRIRRDVGDDHALPAIRGGTARAGDGPDHRVLDRRTPRVWQRRRGD